MSPWTPAKAADPISVAIAHTDPLVRAGLAAVLTPDRGFTVAMADDSTDTEPNEPDVTVADYETALSLLDRSRSTSARPTKTLPRIMVLSHRDRASEIRHALDLGVQGYLLMGCDLDEMMLGVRALHRGQHHLDQSAAQRVVESLNHQPLTSREGDVLQLIAVGHVNKTIATELDISVGTVKAHVKAILAKFGAKTRTEAAAIAQRRGLIATAF
ncbi:response regulator transcription factor [Xylophilus sp. GOD-11R]|uniref:response regulator transcription factor n=1 Tax=Xylophilus sp. GOD-11R TaxID=3089814 RepID=UPI00298BFC92|nr:response regulator transcription factor [Xylophilus sp. GOD-11R]WPB58997.1 response regulator transcription factor [Xylophilus sp. GOD-11R]